MGQVPLSLRERAGVRGSLTEIGPEGGISTGFALALTLSRKERGP